MSSEIVSGRDLRELDDAIVKLRNEEPGIDYQEMADRLGDSPSHIAARVRKLITLGAIESRGGPGYRPKGRE